jgi:hypothetical protein
MCKLFSPNSVEFHSILIVIFIVTWAGLSMRAGLTLFEWSLDRMSAWLGWSWLHVGWTGKCADFELG